MTISVEPGSFRDPSGFVFYRENRLFRLVRNSYRNEYDQLLQSGLYEALVDKGLLISHVEEPRHADISEDAYRILRPERVPFISYPYEWCFSQLQDAALTTLRIQKQALERGMSLKDASAYNIQFLNGAPVFIDTLSFEPYTEGEPWVAYRQFCQHFLAPLALMCHKDIRLGQLLRTNIDGVPLDLASSLLPRSTWLDPGLLMHVHLHAAAQKKYEGKAGSGSRASGAVNRTATLGIIDSLESTIKKQTWKAAGTTWARYYTQTNYSDQAMEGKRQVISRMLDAVNPQPTTVWDLGANTGVFSRLASSRGANTIAWDIDPAAVEMNYLACRASKETRVLPLLEDLTNPSPDLGWELKERQSLIRRGPADMVMSLALVHHMAIGNNVPLENVARFLSAVGRWLIVEFVPKSDTQVQKLLAGRKDIFPEYTITGFEAAFQRFFEIALASPVPDSERTLYLLRASKQSV